MCSIVDISGSNNREDIKILICQPGFVVVATVIPLAPIVVEGVLVVMLLLMVVVVVGVLLALHKLPASFVLCAAAL